MGTALIAVLALAPWLELTPLASSALASVLLGALALAAACHGAGQAIALATRRTPAAPALAIGWGLAALVVIGGLLMALHVFLPTPLVGAAAGLHTVFVVHERAAIRTWLARTELRWSLPWIGLLALVALVQLAGAAGSLTARPFDDDGHVAGQIARLVQTGTLADAIGYPRTFQLGANVVLGALATEPQLALAIDRGFAFVLVLVLACTRIGPADPETGLWAALVVLLASALAFEFPDAAPCWSAVLLLVTLYLTIEDADGSVATIAPVALIAATLVALRNELAPAALTAAVGAWAVRDREGRTLARLAFVVATIAVALAPFVIARQLAWVSLDDKAAALLAPKLPSLGLRSMLFAAVLAVACPLLVLATRARWAAYATAAGVAGIVSELAGDRPYATRFVWPLVLALVLVLVIQLARRAVTSTSLITATLAVLLVYEGANARGRLAWTQRYADLLAGVEYLRHEPASRPHRDYERVLASVPPGATVAVWVAHPELLDHARYRVIDLRTPRIAPYREIVYGPHRPRLRDLLRDVRYLLVEREDHRIARSQGNLLHRIMCAELHPGCADDLELLLLVSPSIAIDGSLQLLSLSR